MSRKLTQMILMIASLIVLSMVALADPGDANEARIVSDQKAGSVLVYNIYTSSASNSGAENTRISITNTDDVRPAAVHLFYVDGASCSVADNYICLTKSQTTSFLASDVDPGTTGYIVAVATDSDGNPVAAKLIGDEYVKFSSNHVAALGAEVLTVDSITTTTAERLNMVASFKVVVPRVLAIANIPSEKDSNNTKVIVNRIGGDLRTSADKIGSLFGLVFDELENGYSFNISGGTCQINRSLSDGFPRTAPRLSNIIPAGSTGWMKFWATTDQGLLGAVINTNSQSKTNATAYEAGHNLHKLTYTTATLMIPTFQNMCFPVKHTF